MSAGEALETAVPPGYARGAPVPWWAKLGIKLGLASIGIHGDRARRLGLAEPSIERESASRLVGTPMQWWRWAEEVLARPARSLLEVGPGRMVVRAPVLRALGFERLWFIDPADTAPRDPAAYRHAAALAAQAGLTPPDLAGLGTREAILEACGARLLTGGPAALSAIPAGSIDVAVSEAVLEHVRRADLGPLLEQLRRVAAPGGCGRHWIDMHDHLGGGLQHLRFGPGFWESPLVGRAGIYVNRIGLSGFVGAFEAAGFAVTVPERMAWAEAPPGPAAPHPANGRSPADDRICAATLVVRPAMAHGA